MTVQTERNRNISNCWGVACLSESNGTVKNHRFQILHQFSLQLLMHTVPGTVWCCPLSLLNLGVQQLPLRHEGHNGVVGYPYCGISLGYHNCGTPCKQGVLGYPLLRNLSVKERDYLVVATNGKCWIGTQKMISKSIVFFKPVPQ